MLRGTNMTSVQIYNFFTWVFYYLGQTFSWISENMPFSSPTWFVVAILGFFVWLFSKANRDPNSPVQWEDLMLDASTNKISPYKMGYLIGVIVSTYIVILFADEAINGGNESFLAVFITYLTYLTGGALSNTWAKRGQGLNGGDHDGSLPPPSSTPPTGSKGPSVTVTIPEKTD